MEMEVAATAVTRTKGNRSFRKFFRRGNVLNASVKNRASRRDVEHHLDWQVLLGKYPRLDPKDALLSIGRQLAVVLFVRTRYRLVE